MIEIRNHKTVNIIFDELIIQPGLNFIEKTRYESLILAEEENRRTFENLVESGDLEIV